MWVEFVLKTDSGYPKDANVTLFTLANPGNFLRFDTHWSAPPVSALARSGGLYSESYKSYSQHFEKYPPLPYPIHVFTHETWLDAYSWIGVKSSLACEWAEERSICISAAFLVLYLWGKEGGSGSRSIERLWHKSKGGVCACVLLVHTAPAKLPAVQYVTTLPSVAKTVTRTWTWGINDHMYTYTLSVSLFFSRSPSFSLTHSLSLVLFFFSLSLFWCLFFTHTQRYIQAKFQWLDGY